MEPEKVGVHYNQEHAEIVSAHQQGNTDIKFRMLTEFLRTQDHSGFLRYTISQLKEFARCFFYQDYSGKGAPAPGSSTWSKAKWRERISFKFMEMYAAGWLDLEFGSDSWRDEKGNVDIAAYSSVKATVETMRLVLEEGTSEHMDEHWNLTLPVHYLTLGFIYQHGWRVVYEDGEERFPNDFQELYDESWGPEHRNTAIKKMAQEGARSVIDQVTISGSPAESDAGGALYALRKRNLSLNERCNTQQLILEQNAKRIESQQRKIEELTALNELAADKIDPLIEAVEQAKSLASQLQVAEVIMERNAEQIKSQQRKIEELTALNELAADKIDPLIEAVEQAKSLASQLQVAEVITERNAEQIKSQKQRIEELTAVIAQLDTGKDRVDQQPVNQTEPLDVCDERGVIDMEALTQGMGELMCKDEKLKEAMERLLPNAPPLDEDEIKKSGEVMRKKIKIKKKKKKDKEQA
jgi:hypothetical protein